MRKFYLAIAIAAIAAPLLQAQDEFDDIYYNPKKDHASVQKKKKQSNYIKDFSDMDVDDYNRRGFYYNSPVDTIGTTAETDQDFVYTQQIQKYYNPTIVLDNADVLADVLDNSYGNVDIIINNDGLPTFAPLYVSPYWASMSWNWGPSWSWSWNWGPSWTWSWGPSWSWGSVVELGLGSLVVLGPVVGLGWSRLGSLLGLGSVVGLGSRLESRLASPPLCRLSSRRTSSESSCSRLVAQHPSRS